MRNRNVFKMLLYVVLLLFLGLFQTDIVVAEEETDAISLYADDYAYQALAKRSNGTKRQALYQTILTHEKGLWNSTETLTNHTADGYVIATVSLQEYGLTETEVIETYFSVKNDYPIFYYMSGTMSFDTSGNLLLLTDEMYRYPSHRNSYQERILSAIKTYSAAISGMSSKYEMVKEIHDMLIASMDYAYDENGNPSEDAWAHNIIGAFVNEKGVCESYARAYQLLLNAAGIDNVFVTGVSNNQNHAWNIVQLDDGAYYYVDCTWDDTNGGAEYFAKGSYDFDISHVKNVSSGTGVLYLYDLPESSCDNYEKKLTLNCNGKEIGRFGSATYAFSKMTDASAEYELIMDADAGVTIPAGNLPTVKLIAFRGNVPENQFVPIYLAGDCTAYSDIEISGVDFDSAKSYLATQKKNATLYLGTNTFSVTGQSRFGGYVLFVDGAQNLNTGVNINGDKGSVLKTSALVEIRTDSIIVDKIHIYDGEMDDDALHCVDTDVNANALYYHGMTPSFRVMGYAELPVKVNIGKVSVEEVGFVNIQDVPKNSELSFGTISGKKNSILSLGVNCIDKEKYPNIQFTNAKIAVHYSLSTASTTVFDADDSRTYAVWEDAWSYKGALFNAGKTDMKNIEIHYQLEKINSNYELETYLTKEVSALCVKKKNGDVYRKYDENYKIVDNHLVQYVFGEKCKAKSLVIPEGVEVIDAWAFRDCGSVTSMELPSSLTTIYDSAIIGCPKLKSIMIPDTVTSLFTQAVGYNYNEKTQAVKKVSGFVILCGKGTQAETYAKDNGIKCKYIPNTVKGVKVKKSTASSITLSWKKNSSASGYVIKQYKSGKWVTKKTFTKNSAVSYTVKGLKAGSTHQFRIIAYQKNGKNKVFGTHMAISVTTNPKAVSKLKASKATKTNVTLKWSKNTSVDGYVLECYKNGKWVKLSKVTDKETVTYTVKGLKKGTTYKFRIKTYIKVDKKTYYSSYKIITVKTKK